MPNEDLDLGEVLLQWQAPTIVRHERSKRWYIVAGVFAAVCIAYALWSGAWSFALVIAAIVKVLVGGLRVSEEVERQGLDISEHGEEGYVH